MTLRDQLTVTTGEAKIELTEEELSQVAGGSKTRATGGKPLEFLKIGMEDVVVSGNLGGLD
jgi:bacteriocin-like protein